MVSGLLSTLLLLLGAPLGPEASCSPLDLAIEGWAFPVAETTLAFNALLDDRDVTVVGIPGADHGGGVDYGPGRRRRAPEAVDARIGWILAAAERGGTAPETPRPPCLTPAP